MGDAPMPGTRREAIDRWSSDSSAESYAVPADLLRDIVDRVVQNTQATGAAIAVGTKQEMTCRATAGEYFSEVGSRFSTISGLTGLCTSTELTQYCMNTLLDDRVDAEACRELGIGAIVVAPLFHHEQLLGLIGMYSSRPYAFGNRDFSALESLREEFSIGLRRRSQIAADAAQETALSSAPVGKTGLVAGIRKLGQGILRSMRSFRITPAN
jgi:GAF domain